MCKRYLLLFRSRSISIKPARGLVWLGESDRCLVVKLTAEEGQDPLHYVIPFYARTVEGRQAGEIEDARPKRFHEGLEQTRRDLRSSQIRDFGRADPEGRITPPQLRPQSEKAMVKRKQALSGLCDIARCLGANLLTPCGAVHLVRWP